MLSIWPKARAATASFFFPRKSRAIDVRASTSRVDERYRGWFPAAQRRKRQPATNNAARQHHKPHHRTVEYSPLMKSTILLLASDPVVRSVMKETLEREGYTVLSTGDLGNAVDRLKEVQPDLLITRTYVEGLPGHDAAKYLRTKSPKMKVLMVGGLMSDDRLELRESLAGFEIFPKPYSAVPNCSRK